MGSRMLRRAAALTALAVLVGLPEPARALSPAEIDCRTAVARNMRKYSLAVFKVINKCHVKRNKGKLSLATDCNELAQADPNNRLEARRNKVRSKIGGSNDKCIGAGSLLAQYSRCPSPGAAADDGAPTTGIDTFAELGECIVALADGLTGLTTRHVLGLPSSKPDKKTLGKCHKDIGKRFTKLIATYGKVRANCQKDLDEEPGSMAEYGCTTADSGGRIAKRAAKLKDRIADRCDFVDPFSLSPGNETLDILKACGDTVPQLQTCIADVAAPRFGSGMIAAAYELPDDCRAGGLGRLFKASFGLEITTTQFDAGSNGIAHGIDFNDRFLDPLTLDCDEDCANCVLQFNTSKDQPRAPCRCVNNTTVACDTLNGPDADDCGAVDNHCDCYFGPPLPVAASGAPVCVPIRILQDYDAGTADLGTGVWDNPLQVAAVIHLGESTLAPCPLCEGDIAADDGNRDGTCGGGTRVGQDCDVNGFHPTWGPISFDCQPISTANISGQGLLLNFPLSTGASTLPATLPCDNPSNRLCPCRVCSGDVTVGCRNDQECIDAGVGTCTGTGGIGISPNGCSDFECSEDEECDAGPVDKTCDGQVHASGKGYIACQTDADCQAQAAGNCSQEQRRRCFKDPIEVTGRPGIFGADVGGFACLGATDSPAINAASGLPGPVRANVNFASAPTCADDPTVVWQPPGGTNCSTTGTTLPPSPCGDTFPICGGDCPVGQACSNTGVICECTSTTTTTLPTCGDTYPLCGGECPIGEECTFSVAGCSCEVPAAACGDTFPACDGECPGGQVCQDTGGACGCVNQACGDTWPQCGGDCPMGQACEVNTLMPFECVCSP